MMNIKVISFIQENKELQYYNDFKNSLKNISDHNFIFKSLTTVNYLEAFSFLDSEIKENDCELVIVSDPYCKVIKNLDSTFETFLNSECILGGTTNISLFLETFICDKNYKSDEVMFLNSKFCLINPLLYTNDFSLEDVEIMDEKSLYDKLSMVLNIISNKQNLYIPFLMSKDTSTVLDYDNIKVVCFNGFDEDFNILYPFDIFGEYLDNKEYTNKINKFGKSFIINEYKRNTIISVIGTKNCELINQNIKHS